MISPPACHYEPRAKSDPEKDPDVGIFDSRFSIFDFRFSNYRFPAESECENPKSAEEPPENPNRQVRTRSFSYSSSCSPIECRTKKSTRTRKSMSTSGLHLDAERPSPRIFRSILSFFLSVAVSYVRPFRAFLAGSSFDHEGGPLRGL